MLGPSGVIKICSAADSTSSGHSVAVCNGSGLMEALSVVHPAGALLKESVHGQQVCRPRTDDLSTTAQVCGRVNCPSARLIFEFDLHMFEMLTWNCTAQSDAGTGSTLLLSIVGPLLDRSVRLVHEGCSIQRIVRALRRMQETSRVLLDSAAIHMHELIPHAAYPVPCPSGSGFSDRCDGGREGAVDREWDQTALLERMEDDLGWFGQLSVKDKGVKDLDTFPGADSDKQRCTDCPVSPQGVKDDEEGKEAREAWKMRLGMGLAHGNEEAMLLAISALARLGAAPSHARAHGQHVGARHRHASATRHHLHTTLAAGLDASASVALAGLVIAVSEARVLLRRRLLALRAARGSGCPVV